MDIVKRLQKELDDRVEELRKLNELNKKSKTGEADGS
jgi:hypothetical protein